jgi:hypothetical protein
MYSKQMDIFHLSFKSPFELEEFASSFCFEIMLGQQKKILSLSPILG